MHDILLNLNKELYRVISMGQIELQTVCLCSAELFEIDLFDHLAMCKQKLS